MNEDQAATKLEAIIKAVKEAHANNVGMTVILDGGSDVLTTANLALHVVEALKVVLPPDTNVIATPGAGSMMLRIESPKHVKTYGVMNLAAFDALVRAEHEPMERNNPGFKGHPMYLFGVAIENVLNKHFLVYNAPVV